METLRQDLRHGWRVFGRQPGLWLLAVLTLSAGTGVNGTLFTFARALMQGQERFDQHRTLVVRSIHPQQGRGLVTRQDVAALRTQSPSLRDWVTYERAFAALTSAGTSGEAQRVEYQQVSANFLTASGAKLALGRGFIAADYDPRQPPVAVISWALWQNRFAAANDIVGRQLGLDGVEHTIVGVASRESWFPSVGTSLWVPARDSSGDSRTVNALATLAAGASREQAKQELAALSQRLAGAQPATHARWTLAPLTLAEGLYSENDRTAVFLMELLGLGILIMACANVANLLLVHAIGRRRELAVRTALGAGSFRLIRQMTVESLWLAIPATLTGLVLTSWCGELLFRRIAGPAGLPVPVQMVDARVAGFTIALSLVSLVFFSFPAAWQARRLELAAAMRDGYAGGGTSSQSRWLARGFVVLQFGLAMALIVTAGIVARGVVAFSSLDVGFPTERLWMASAQPSPKRYATPKQAHDFYQRGLVQLRAHPEVAAAGLIAVVPQVGGDGVGTAFAREPDRGLPPDQQAQAFLLPVGDGALEALGVRRQAGRLIEATDTATSEKVVVANETAAKGLSSEPIGERVCFLAAAARDCYRVVGVVADIRRANLARAVAPAFYVPAGQMERREYQWLIRSRNDASAAIAGLRTTLAAVDPEEPVAMASVAEENYRDLEGSRLFAAIVSSMGSLALFLAGVGLFCLLSYQVSQQAREWGIRLALGARGVDIQRQVAWQGLRLLALGAIPGFALAFASARLLSGMLPPGTAFAPTVWIGAAMVLLSAGLAAVLRPAWRAARIDPIVALRID